ncbi:hypothetical protein [Streptomyces wuyuanensis]|uniref:hypothetical protein n=1 Tax=Streptomyces wuyuanensis TaxID=1196353 RepID=UPI003445BFA5
MNELNQCRTPDGLRYMEKQWSTAQARTTAQHERRLLEEAWRNLATNPPDDPDQARAEAERLAADSTTWTRSVAEYFGNGTPIPADLVNDGHITVARIRIPVT